MCPRLNQDHSCVMRSNIWSSEFFRISFIIYTNFHWLIFWTLAQHIMMHDLTQNSYARQCWLIYRTELPKIINEINSYILCPAVSDETQLRQLLAIWKKWYHCVFCYLFSWTIFSSDLDISDESISRLLEWGLISKGMVVFVIWFIKASSSWTNPQSDKYHPIPVLVCRCVVYNLAIF